VKADGLALGKGVLICRDMAQADRAIEEVLVKRAFGGAGASIVLQELLEGMEISLHALCDGQTAKLFPTAQDHKRALGGDLGLNTGGMGAYSPTPFLSEAELAGVGDSILNPWLRGCAAEGIDFHGILYPGVMLTQAGPKVLEFNARFGDPETEAILVRLETDIVDLFDAAIDGTAHRLAIKMKPGASVCVIAASGGYPGKVDSGAPIAGLDSVHDPDTVVFHSGTAAKDGAIVTAGGRVLGVTAVSGPSSSASTSALQQALSKAYSTLSGITFEGMQFRRDIGWRALRDGL
jgi:phosphoribosylamine--glycine ligase